MENPIVKSLLEKDFRLSVDPELTLPDMVKEAISRVGSHIAGNEDLKTLLGILPKGNFTLCPDSPTEELHEYLVSRYAKIDKSDPRLVSAFIGNFVFETAFLARKAMAFGAGNIKDVTADELIMLSDPFVPRAIDKLWLAWYKSLVIPFEILPEGEKKRKKQELNCQMAEYDYTVFAGGQQQALAEAFPAEIGEVVSALERLQSMLQSKPIKSYLKLLAKAFSSKKISQLEKLWADVDWAFIRIPAECRVFPVHGMESGYEHPFGVSPEWRIMVRLNYGREEIVELCRIAPEIFGKLGIASSELADKLQYTDIGVFYSAIWSGVNANFRYAGQVVPNREKIRQAGSKIFIDLDSEVKAVERYKKLLNEFVFEAVAGELSDYVDTFIMTIHTAGHEIAHPAGRSEEIDANLGDARRLLEEAKATMGGNLLVEGLDPSSRKKLIALTIARICRFFSKTTMENPSSQQYVWECMVACNTLHQAGIIALGENCIKVDMEKINQRHWFIQLEKFVESIISAYRIADTPGLQSMHQELCSQEKGIVGQIISLVNSK